MMQLTEAACLSADGLLEVHPRSLGKGRRYSIPDLPMLALDVASETVAIGKAPQYKEHIMPWDWIINLQKVSTYSVFQKDSASDPAGEDSSGLPASTQMKQKRQRSLFRARTALPCPRPLDEAEDAAILFPSSNGVVGRKRIAWARWRSTCPRRRSKGAAPDQS
jgi:hypothetical protein